MKTNLKKIISKSKLAYNYKLVKYNHRAKMNYDEIENFINKKYKKMYGKDINWSNPITYNEKLNVSKVYGTNEVKASLTDKCTVRDWVKERIGDEYLIPLLETYDNVEQIDLNNLPDKFVMKMNNDSGSAFVCEDKSKINISEIKKTFSYYCKRNYAYIGFEMHYKDIKPKIMVEKFMGKNIKDYKIMCFDGKPYCCVVDYDRFKKHKRNCYDLKWDLLPFKKGNYENVMNDKKPDNYEKMIELARKLSTGFDQVRVDFYDVDGKVYFGEMTFTNGNGLVKFYPDEWDRKIGEMWNFDNTLREKIRSKS